MLKTKESLMVWWHVLLAHIWSAACWVKPGWFPATVALASIFLACLALYRERLETKKDLGAME